MTGSLHDLRFLRPVRDPIPWHLRIGYSDHKLLENRLSAGDARINRAVFDTANLERHGALLRLLQSRAAELVLDPRSTVPAGSVGASVEVRRSRIPRRVPFQRIPRVEQDNQRPIL